METTDKTPYEILDVPTTVHYVELRKVYRTKIHEYKQKKINPIEYRRICRAYETLSDFDKRKQYDSRKKWTSELGVHKYTLQQLAAEFDLLDYLKRRLEDARIHAINGQDPVTGHTALYCAARAGNVEAVKLLIERGAESDLSQRTKSTALHGASFYGHADVVRCLLESGADYRIVNTHNSTAEKEAYGDAVKQVFSELKEHPYVRVAANELEWFYENGLTQHQDTEYFAQRQTLLHCASRKGYFDLVRWLVEKCSANIDLLDFNRNSPLHLAIYGGHSRVVDYLLNRGCNPKYRNRWGTTAEEEGVKHGRWIVDLFQSMRNRNMYEMAREGVKWWFDYYFDTRSANKLDPNGVSLLYHACRYGQYSVVEWLLDNGANINVQMSKKPQSTPLHGAKYHGHVSIVELLLQRGADITIKNAYGATVLDEAVCDTVSKNLSDRIKELLEKYQRSLFNHKLIDVEIYLHELDATRSVPGSREENPVVTIQIDHTSNYQELIAGLPENLKNQNHYFAIAGRPLNFQSNNESIISAVVQARYVNSKFVDTPLCLTLHSTPLKSQSPKEISESLPIDHRRLSTILDVEKKMGSFLLKYPFPASKTFKCGNLTFTFPANCVKSNVTFEVTKFGPPLNRKHGLPHDAFYFKTSLANGSPSDALLLLPQVTIQQPSNVRLYTLAMPSFYWYSSDTRPNQLPVLGGVHAFIRHANILTNLLSLPVDIFIVNTLSKPLESRNHPVPCQYLALRKHDKHNFPHVAYHGTNIHAVRSILINGLVVPGTVVSSGKCINPPPNHFAREKSYFNIPDFATAVFLSPSVYYSCDPLYAAAFTYGDQDMILVLECSVKENSFTVFKNTSLNYVAHSGEDLEKIEWRVKDPMDVEINGVLFITKIRSISSARAVRKATIVGTR